MKKIFSILSLCVGIIGLGLFLKPVLEIICGISGLVFAFLGKDKEAGVIMEGICYWGRNIAWINIIWVCLEFGLKYFGVDLFQLLGIIE